MALHTLLSFFSLVLLLSVLTNAHFPGECRCVCHISSDALSQARDDCFLPGAGKCFVRLCRSSDFAGFACCMPNSSHPPGTLVPAITPPPQIFPSSSPALAPTSAEPSRPQQSFAPDESFMESPEQTYASDTPGISTPSPSPASSTALSRPDRALIRFAADDMARLFINGVLTSAINDWAAYATVTTRLFFGDVVGIEVMDIGGRWHGIIAEVVFAQGAFVTGRDEWRAVASGAVADGDWSLREYDACGWPMAKVKEGDGVWFAGKAVDYPEENGARYVWATNASAGAIFLRFVVGGAGCS